MHTTVHPPTQSCRHHWQERLRKDKKQDAWYIPWYIFTWANEQNGKTQGPRPGPQPQCSLSARTLRHRPARHTQATLAPPFLCLSKPLLTLLQQPHPTKNSFINVFLSQNYSSHFLIHTCLNKLVYPNPQLLVLPHVIPHP